MHMLQEEQESHTAGSWQELLSVAWPLVISSGSLTLMYVTDRMFLTWYSTEALAAAMPAGYVHWTLISLAFGTAAYVNTFVAQYEGAGRKDRVAASVWQGVYFSLGAGAVLLPLAPLAANLFTWLGHEPEVRRLEADYFSVLCYGTAPILLSAALAGYYTGRGKTLVVMWVNVVSVAMNAVLAWLLIFGKGPLPEWGIKGAAVATVLANLLSAVIYAVMIRRDAKRNGYDLEGAWRFDRELFGRLLRFGLPSGFNWFVDVICWAVFLQIVGMLGTKQLAATNLAFNLNSLAFIPLLGIGTAVSTLTGRRIGEGRPELAVRTTWVAFGMAAAFTLTFAAVYILAPDLILMPYAAKAGPDFPAIREQVVLLLRFVAVYSIFDAMTVVFGGAIRGAGDTRFSLWYSGITGGLLLVLPNWLAQRYGTAGMMSAWLSVTAFVMVLGVGFMVRFQLGRWKSMRVIEAEAPLAPAPAA